MASVAVYTDTTKTATSPRRNGQKMDKTIFEQRNRTLLNNDSSIIAIEEANIEYNSLQGPASVPRKALPGTVAQMRSNPRFRKNGSIDM